MPISAPPALNTALKWRHRIAAIPVSKPTCHGISAADWPTMKQNALDFLKRFGQQAVEMVWMAGDLFGVHPTRGTTRVDHAGALMPTSGGVAHEVTDHTVRFPKTNYFRNIAGRPVGIPVWAFKE